MEEIVVSEKLLLTKLCRWFEVHRRTVYYKPVKSTPKVQERFAAPIKQMIEAEPSFGYRTVASLLQFNKNTVQRIFQLKGWQVLKRAIGHRPRLVRSYGLRQEFITPHCPQQNGMIERVIRTLEEQCVHRHRFETQQHASRVIGEWIRFYNHRRPHQTLGMKTPAMAYALAA